MKMLLSNKVLMPVVAVALAVATWAAVMAAVGRPSKRRRPPAVARAPAPVVAAPAGSMRRLGEEEWAARAAIRPPGISPHLDGSLFSGPMSVEVSGRRVTVRGSAEVMDRRPGHHHIWLLRIY